ncbi:carboxymuconolactone decarboxylase family protein [Flavisolibacter tropicus]|uniref:Carboxymuconolactone decarboxylase n=1 Tax=Flavisolibacter tropicus TaxID=1492898 RepID=A0A172TR37_9BACT|nr:carboxymuconolactone decarboxylase family protein [Flavisolibacter tropicus]ANE49223.1 carboxymuconolactone decarboxylase [Flavisolibacter tropicus]
MPHINLRTDLFGITSLLDYRKEVAKPLCELTQLLLRGESTLSEAEREMIAAHVSYLNECKFCSSAHHAAACVLPGGDKPATGKMKSLLAIAEKVQLGGNHVHQEQVDEARQQGATDREIHDTVLIAALFCLYNRYVDGLATVAPADPNFYAALAKRITTRGYRMPEDGYHALTVNK